MLSAPGTDVARQALTGGYIGIPYSQLDCQGFVERVLYDTGIRKPDGSPYNWKGSNSMWRNYVKWKGTITECTRLYGEVPPGAFVFIIKNDGGEKDRGYYDGQGNATHVGLCVSPHDDLAVMDSQPTGGVQRRRLSLFNHVALMDMITYGNPDPQDDDLLHAIRLLRSPNTSDSDYLDALRILTDGLLNE